VAPQIPFEWPEINPTYRGVVTLEDVGGQLECTKFEFEALAGQTISAVSARKLPVGRLIANAKMALIRGALAAQTIPPMGRGEMVVPGQLPPWVTGKPLATQPLDAEAQRHRDEYFQRTGEAARREVLSTGYRYGPGHLERVAGLYAWAYARGDNPVVVIAEAYLVTRKAASEWVRRARRKGLLPPTKPGVARANPPTKRKPS
jgi:hypothetical protein